jgi:hypothetical protein
MPLITNGRVSTSVIFARVILGNIKNQTELKKVIPSKDLQKSIGKKSDSKNYSNNKRNNLSKNIK